MEEQNHEQTHPAKPTGPRSRWLRRLALPAAVAALAVVYQLTRPPELVWWRSPLFDKAGHRVRMLVPFGWENQVSPTSATTGNEVSQGIADFLPPDKRPTLFGITLGFEPELGRLTISRFENAISPEHTQLRTEEDGSTSVWTFSNLSDKKSCLILIYRRPRGRSFTRTYKQICNSLTIE